MAKTDLVFTTGDTETFALSENNGVLVEIILFSDQFHTRRADEMKDKNDVELKDLHKWDIIHVAARTRSISNRKNRKKNV
jgi:hypothetical protein